MSLLAYSTNPNGLMINTESDWCLITPYSTSLFRIQFNQKCEFDRKDGFSVQYYSQKEKFHFL